MGPSECFHGWFFQVYANNYCRSFQFSFLSDRYSDLPRDYDLLDLLNFRFIIFEIYFSLLQVWLIINKLQFVQVFYTWERKDFSGFMNNNNNNRSWLRDWRTLSGTQRFHILNYWHYNIKSHFPWMTRTRTRSGARGRGDWGGGGVLQIINNFLLFNHGQLIRT